MDEVVLHHVHIQQQAAPPLDAPCDNPRSHQIRASASWQMDHPHRMKLGSSSEHGDWTSLSTGHQVTQASSLYLKYALVMSGDIRGMLYTR